MQTAADEDRRLVFEDNSCDNHRKDARLHDETAGHKQQQEFSWRIEQDLTWGQLQFAGEERLRIKLAYPHRGAVKKAA